jgi:hypothetical protein
MMTRLKAALAYFAIVFTVGFMAGPIRMFWLEPQFGTTVAVALETPILLMAMLFAARYVPRRLGLRRRAADLLAMGGLALMLVLLADIAVGLGLRNMPLNQVLGYFFTPAGLIYSGALLAFALMPLLVAGRSAPPPD